jgi:hypothetical protein
MVEEVGELEPGDGLPERKLLETFYDGRMSESESEWMPWLPLYRVRGQDVYKANVFLTEGS